MQQQVVPQDFGLGRRVFELAGQCQRLICHYLCPDGVVPGIGQGMDSPLGYQGRQFH